MIYYIFSGKKFFFRTSNDKIYSGRVFESHSSALETVPVYFRRYTKSVDPFCLVFMPGDVNYLTHGAKCVTCRGLQIIAGQ